MYQRKCSRCSGEGKLWQHANISGGVCFKCNGNGIEYVKTDPSKLEAARAKRQAKAEAVRIAAIAAGQNKADTLAAKYQDDPRMGPECLARCLEFPMVADETYKVLDMIDTGAYKYGGIEDFNNIIR